MIRRPGHRGGREGGHPVSESESEQPDEQVAPGHRAAAEGGGPVTRPVPPFRRRPSAGTCPGSGGMPAPGPSSVKVLHGEVLRDDWPMLVRLLVEAGRELLPGAPRPASGVGPARLPAGPRRGRGRDDRGRRGVGRGRSDDRVRRRLRSRPRAPPLLAGDRRRRDGGRVRPIGCRAVEHLAGLRRRRHPQALPAVAAGLEPRGRGHVRPGPGGLPVGGRAAGDRVGARLRPGPPAALPGGGVDGWALALTSLRDLFGVHDTQSMPIIDFSAPRRPPTRPRREATSRPRPTGSGRPRPPCTSPWPRPSGGRTATPGRGPTTSRARPDARSTTCGPPSPCSTSCARPTPARPSAPTATTTWARSCAPTRAGSSSTSRVSRDRPLDERRRPRRCATWPGCCGRSTTRRAVALTERRRRRQSSARARPGRRATARPSSTATCRRRPTTGSCRPARRRSTPCWPPSSWRKRCTRCSYERAHRPDWEHIPRSGPPPRGRRRVPSVPRPAPGGRGRTPSRWPLGDRVLDAAWSRRRPIAGPLPGRPLAAATESPVDAGRGAPGSGGRDAPRRAEGVRPGPYTAEQIRPRGSVRGHRRGPGEAAPTSWRSPTRRDRSSWRTPTGSGPRWATSTSTCSARVATDPLAGHGRPRAGAPGRGGRVVRGVGPLGPGRCGSSATSTAGTAALHPMRMLGASGVWELFVPGVEAGHRYKFELVAADGSLILKTDPFAFATEVPPSTAAIIGTEAHPRLGRPAWMERRAADRRHGQPHVGVRAAPGLVAAGAGGGQPARSPTGRWPSGCPTTWSTWASPTWR